MFEDDLKAAWKRGDAHAAPLSRAAIEGLLRPATQRTGRTLESLVRAYVVMLAVTALLACVNLYGYRSNPAMLAVEGALAVGAAAFAVLGLRLVALLRRIGRADLPLLETVEQRLSLYERWFEPALFIGAATPWIFTLAITTLIENEHGTYRVSHPGEFAVVTAVMLGGTYLMLRVSTTPAVREMRAVLHDLRSEAIEATPVIAAVQRRARFWMGIGVVAVALAVILTLLVWLKVL